MQSPHHTAQRTCARAPHREPGVVSSAKPAGSRYRTAARDRAGAARGEHFGCVVVHEAGRGTVAWIRGPLDVDTAPHVLRRLNRVVAQPLDRLTVDLADVGEVDDVGVAALRTARRWAAARGVVLTFEAATRAVRDGLEEAGPRRRRLG